MPHAHIRTNTRGSCLTHNDTNNRRMRGVKGSVRKLRGTQTERVRWMGQGRVRASARANTTLAIHGERQHLFLLRVCTLVCVCACVCVCTSVCLSVCASLSLPACRSFLMPKRCLLFCVRVCVCVDRMKRFGALTCRAGKDAGRHALSCTAGPEFCSCGDLC